ncbi:MAG: cob(I)yrinic acid a,c-diamide adenosyltransferase [Magnetococcales bacterium]|nr:cob(I)yrinic acid a,c-diamide adenosyltransferase [Magnetococcales bacterium]
MEERTKNQQTKQSQRPGRVVVLTGPGKGKSSSAFGMVLRAAGWNYRVCVIQFIKKESRKTGEQMAAETLPGVEWHCLGDGFTWVTKDPEKDKSNNQKIWAFSQEKIRSDQFDLVVLDEINYAASYGWISGEEIATFIQKEKPTRTHLILTGRDALPEVIDVADTVTEMGVVKHAFEQGIPAGRGIEF